MIHTPPSRRHHCTSPVTPCNLRATSCAVPKQWPECHERLSRLSSFRVQYCRSQQPACCIIAALTVKQVSMWLLSYSGQVLICILGMSEWRDGCMQGSSAFYTCCIMRMASVSCPMHDMCEKWSGGAWGGVRDRCAVGQPAGSDDQNCSGQHPTPQRTLRQGVTCDEAEGGRQPPHCHPYLGPITPIMIDTHRVMSCPT